MIYQFTIEKNTTEFSLLGDDKVVLEVKDKYEEKGYIAKSNGKNIADRVKINSKVRKYFLQGQVKV